MCASWKYLAPAGGELKNQPTAGDEARTGKSSCNDMTDDSPASIPKQSVESRPRKVSFFCSVIPQRFPSRRHRWADLLWLDYHSSITHRRLWCVGRDLAEQYPQHHMSRAIRSVRLQHIDRGCRVRRRVLQSESGWPLSTGVCFAGQVRRRPDTYAVAYS